MLRSAPFETPSAAAPQDRLARLEARIHVVQPLARSSIASLQPRPR
jgi:hypothetical protein